MKEFLPENVTHLKLILGFDKESYYPLKIAEKSRCATVLFRGKNVTMSTNRTSFLGGMVSHHHPGCFYGSGSIDSILNR